LIKFNSKFRIRVAGCQTWINLYTATTETFQSNHYDDFYSGMRFRRVKSLSNLETMRKKSLSISKVDSVSDEFILVENGQGANFGVTK